MRKCEAVIWDRLARACDRYVEWCDYMSDDRWRVWGPTLHPLFRACERVLAAAYARRAR